MSSIAAAAMAEGVGVARRLQSIDTRLGLSLSPSEEEEEGLAGCHSRTVSHCSRESVGHKKSRPSSSFRLYTPNPRSCRATDRTRTCPCACSDGRYTRGTRLNATDRAEPRRPDHARKLRHATRRTEPPASTARVRTTWWSRGCLRGRARVGVGPTCGRTPRLSLAAQKVTSRSK